MKRPLVSPVLMRLLAAAGLIGAFVVMASIFVPDPTEAQIDDGGSVDPHQGLALLGTLEHSCCIVRVYATDAGPRYSVFEIEGESLRELGVLLSAEQVERRFPELPLTDVHFGVQRQLMLAPTRGGRGGWEE